SRAGSVKDAYLAQKQGRSTSLPTGEDWIFRIKVISSATDLGNDVFKNAVQGLVRMCFPEGILDQLGPQALEQHMREEHAPEKNIRRMSEIFGNEMTKRMVSMIAENLDTAAKVDAVLKAMLSTSARAHGDKLGEDIVDYVTARLLRMKAKAPKRSTEWLAHANAPQENDSSDGDVSISGVSDYEPTPPPKMKRHKKPDKESKRARPGADDRGAKSTNPHVSLPAAPLPLQQHTSKGKDRKISSKWLWDIKRADIAGDAVADTFSRTSDLFAYHALPIAKRKLGPDASKKQIRCEMQSLIDGMPAGEFEKWVESLQKLLGGDREMLERPESHPSGDEQQLTRATPAPVDTPSVSRKTTKNTQGSLSRPFIYAERLSTPSPERLVVKREIVTHPSGRSGAPYLDAQINSTSEATGASGRLSTDKRYSQPHVSGAEAEGGHAVRHSRGIIDLAPTIEVETPVAVLLWGTGIITALHCMEVTRTIMNNLDRRISAAVRSRYPTVTPQLIRIELEQAIIYAFPKPGPPFSFIDTLKNIEKQLIPWVVAKPNAFPELRAMPFVFDYMLTHIPVTVNLLFGSWSAVSMMTGHEVWDILMKILQRRGISEESAAGSDVNFEQVDSLCKAHKLPETTRRVVFERVLRKLAFSHKEKFTGIKATSVVKIWEEKTGLRW
ncbi:hypothetical protein BKA58DRAFT_460211, partial [Alternaria rosae]|uniref:uncharacterized protein n=1 Tax=Alternaria rosae TaxID=1187941 RepID=UPI001E8CBC38